MTVVVTPGFKTTALPLVSPNNITGVGSQVLLWQTNDVALYWGARIDGAYYFNTPISGSPNVRFATDGPTPDAQDAPWSGAVGGDGWDRFENHAGKKIGIVYWGNPGSGGFASAFDTTAANIARNRGALSFWRLSTTTQEVLDLANNTNVRNAITNATALATAIKNWGFPIMVAPWWEMNGNWGYNWQTAAGVTSAQYVAAWQKLWGIFQAAGVTNATWMWNPNVIGGSALDPAPWFPGSNYIDWLVMDGYNHGGESVAAIFDTTYVVLTGLDSTKPVMIGETGSTEALGSTTITKTQWISDLFAWMKAHPRVKAFQWFNERGNPTDVHIESSLPALTAFKSEIQTNHWAAANFGAASTTPIPAPTAQFQVQPLQAQPIVYDLNFNGSSGYASVPDAAGSRLETNNAFSYAGWFYLDSYNNNLLPRLWEKSPHFLCVMGDPTNGRYREIGLEVANASGTGNTNGGVSEFWGSTRLAIGQWYHVVVTFDGTSTGVCTMYLNGRAETVTNVFPWSGTMASTTPRLLYLGRRNNDLLRMLDGRMRGPVLFYQRAVSAAEALNIYNGSPPTDGSIEFFIDEGSGTTLADDSGNSLDATLSSITWIQELPRYQGVHFHTQIATDPAFTSIVEEGRSWQDASRFEYEMRPGSWESLLTPLLGVSLPWPGSQAAYNTNLDNYIAMVGGVPDHVQMFRDMTSSMFSTTQMNAIVARGAMPMITSEPWVGVNPPTSAYSLANIAAGNFDTSFFIPGAQLAASWGQPMFLRWAPEMNGTWEPWGPGVIGNTAQDFINAWRHIHDIFVNNGATNVFWVWCPNVYPPGGGTAQPFAQFYPGDAYVDLLGLDGYNWGTLQTWQTWSEVFGFSYDQMASVNSTKPIVIGETASNENGGDKAAWIQSAYATEIPQRTPRIRYVTWFNVNKASAGEADWRVESSARSLAAYQNAVAVAKKYSVGLGFENIGKNIRYNSAQSAIGTYYWRTRVVEFM